jgi:uncharacterized membrane protein YfhO
VRDVSDTDVRVSFVAARPGQLVLHDTFYPGWKAELDGQEVPIRAANGAFRAVAVPAGRHEVRFSYRPASVYAGATLSLIGVLAVLALAGVSLVRSRRAG